MPELPDLTLYVEHLDHRVRGTVLRELRIPGPSLLRTAEPPPDATRGRRVEAVRRLGKRIVLALEGELFLLIHLMRAGRLAWRSAPPKRPARSHLAWFVFDAGVLLLTEAGSRRRATLHLVRGAASLADFDPGGVEPLEVSRAAFAAALRRESHTVKRALTDPGIVAAIGNAYSDEILHRARLSPFANTRRLSEEEMDRLHRATREVLSEWTDRLRREAGRAFPRRVTAFREGMAVHGRFRKPCPCCGSPVQRIVRAETESHYCATCQTGGRLLADRALSKLLREDWPRTLRELEARREALRRGAAPGREDA